MDSYEYHKQHIWRYFLSKKAKDPPSRIIIDLCPHYCKRQTYRGTGRGQSITTLSNQKLNSYLKEIADMCDITKPLTFHIARHIFATTVTLTNGVPIETVSKLLEQFMQRW